MNATRPGGHTTAEQRAAWNRPPTVLPTPKLVVAVVDWDPPQIVLGADTPQQPTLSFAIGDRIVVTTVHEERAWSGGYKEGDNPSNVGWFSSHFVEPADPVERLKVRNLPIA